jgi:hypothetical protein
MGIFSHIKNSIRYGAYEAEVFQYMQQHYSWQWCCNKSPYQMLRQVGVDTYTQITLMRSACDENYSPRILADELVEMIIERLKK